MTRRVPVTVNCPGSLYHGATGFDIGQEPNGTSRVRRVLIGTRTYPLLFTDQHLTYTGAPKEQT
ncbi:MAG: hypothetical protein AAGA37_19905 [Actinomycetota bacterium]